jgi:SPOR domain
MGGAREGDRMQIGQWIACAALVAFGTGCSVQRVPLKDPAKTAPPESGTYDPQREAASPPPPAVQPQPAGAAEPAPTLDVPAPADLDTPGVQVQDLPAPGQPSTPAKSPDARPSQSSTGSGEYHVQVFASTDRDAAERVRAEVETRIGSARLVSEPPYFKVRVGDCPTSEACRDLQERLRAAGYDTVWIVSDTAP